MTSSRSLILSGFKDDCEELIARFDRADDIRFETFSEIWKAMKFSLVFTGRPNFLELLEYCEEILNVCKQFLLLPQRFKERVGGLYLLYGIYYKMPIDQFKVKVKLEDWRNIMDLHAEIKEAEHLDANYILCSMIADNVFHFCIFDSEYGLEKHYRAKNMQCFNPHSVLPALKDLTDKHQILSKISELCKFYEQEKKLLKPKNLSNSSLHLFDSNMADEIIHDIQEFEEKRKQQKMDATNPERASNASTSRTEPKKSNSKTVVRHRMRLLMDDGFQTDSNDSDENEIIQFDDYDDPVLPENFD